VTRGKRLVVLVGQKRALAIAVRGQQTRRRWSKLKEWLQADRGGAGTGRRVPRAATAAYRAASAAASAAAVTRAVSRR
jgi:hypothetical protein